MKGVSQSTFHYGHHAVRVNFLVIFPLEKGYWNLAVQSSSITDRKCLDKPPRLILEWELLKKNCLILSTNFLKFQVSVFHGREGKA